MEYSAKDRENAPLALVSGTSEPPGNVLSTGTKVSTPAAKEWIHFKLAFQVQRTCRPFGKFRKSFRMFHVDDHIMKPKKYIYVIKHW